MKATIDLSAFAEETDGVSFDQMKRSAGLYRATNPGRGLLLVVGGTAYHCDKLDGGLSPADDSWANYRYHRLAAKAALIRFSGD